MKPILHVNLSQFVHKMTPSFDKERAYSASTIAGDYKETYVSLRDVVQTLVSLGYEITEETLKQSLLNLKET